MKAAQFSERVFVKCSRSHDYRARLGSIHTAENDFRSHIAEFKLLAFSTLSSPQIMQIRTVRTGTILKGSLRNRISPSWSMGSQKKIGKVPDRCKLQSLHTVSKTVRWMKQAPRTSSGGEIYKLGHRIIILKNIGCKYIARITKLGSSR